MRRVVDQRVEPAHPAGLPLVRPPQEASSQALPSEGLPQAERLSVVRLLSAACQRAVPPVLPVVWRHPAARRPAACPSGADRSTTALWRARPVLR